MNFGHVLILSTLVFTGLSNWLLLSMGGMVSIIACILLDILASALILIECDWWLET
jgi:hypothetical protein